MEDGQFVRQTLLNGLQGRGSHVNPAAAVEELDWQLAGKLPNGAAHSIWQILQHMIYWQEFSLAQLRNETAETPAHASDTWTTGISPTGEGEWQSAVETFLEGLHAAQEFTKVDLEHSVKAREGRSRAEVMGMLVGHNSYHLGQIVLLRQVLGAWPPPSGGDTW